MSLSTQKGRLRTGDGFVSAAGHPLKQLSNELALVDFVLAAHSIAQRLVGLTKAPAIDDISDFRLDVFNRLSVTNPCRNC